MTQPEAESELVPIDDTLTILLGAGASAGCGDPDTALRSCVSWRVTPGDDDNGPSRMGRSPTTGLKVTRLGDGIATLVVPLLAIWRPGSMARSSLPSLFCAGVRRLPMKS